MLMYERYQALRTINIHVPGEPGNEANIKDGGKGLIARGHTQVFK